MGWLLKNMNTYAYLKINKLQIKSTILIINLITYLGI